MAELGLPTACPLTGLLFLQVNGHLDYMKQMDTILKAVGIKTKECWQEKKGSSSLCNPAAKKPQQAAGSKPGDEEGTEPEQDGAGSEALPAAQHPSRCPRGDTSVPSPHSGDRQQQEE